MKRWTTGWLCVALMLVATLAQGAPWRFVRSTARTTRTVTRTATRTVSSSFSSPQAAASFKAARMAATGVFRHLGGGFGGGHAEGIGYSTSSPQAALNACCYTGQKRVAGSSVVRGKGGWYACKIYF